MKNKQHIYLNAPITLGFVGICILVLLLDLLTGGYSTDLLFSTYGSSLFDPLMYLRLIGHIFGHVDYNHLLSNMLYILLLGPILEEKYHDKLLYVISITALSTGIIHNLLQPNVQLLGASGVVFAFILLASVTGQEKGIPITLILVAFFWIGGEIIEGLSSADSISQLTHIIGGLTGGIFGMRFKRNN